MKRAVFIMVFIFIALQFTDADARSRRKQQGIQNNYILLYGGVNTRPDADITFTGGGTFTDSFDNGTVLGGAIGYRFRDFRLEAELGHRSNDWAFNVPGVEVFEFNVLSFMFNGYYDLNWGRLKPYIGLGVGSAQVKFKQEVLGSSFSDSDTAVAYQFMGGLGFEIIPNITFSAGYRYFTTLEQSYNNAAFKTEYESHEFLTGLRFHF
jgi:opacity protein-like surface antigen